MSYLIGIGVAALVALLGRAGGFDRERSFYPTVLIVVGSYYVLFAAIGGTASDLRVESAVMAAFVAIAVLGFRRNPWLVVAGLAAHGVFDYFHAPLTSNSSAPAWWPAFCLAFDVSAAVYVAALLWWRARRDSNSRPANRPFKGHVVGSVAARRKAGDPW